MDKGERGVESVFAIYRRWGPKSIRDSKKMETESRGSGGFTTEMGSEWGKRKVYSTNLTRKNDECGSTKEESRRDCVEMGEVSG